MDQDNWISFYSVCGAVGDLSQSKDGHEMNKGKPELWIGVPD